MIKFRTPKPGPPPRRAQKSSRCLCSFTILTLPSGVTISNSSTSKIVSYSEIYIRLTTYYPLLDHIRGLLTSVRRLKPTPQLQRSSSGLQPRRLHEHQRLCERLKKCHEFVIMGVEKRPTIPVLSSANVNHRVPFGRMRCTMKFIVIFKRDSLEVDC